MIGLEQWKSLLPDVKVNNLRYHKTTHKLTVDVYRAILPKFQIEKGKKVKQTYEAELTSILEDESRREEREQLFARIESEVVQTPQEFTVRTSSDEGVSTNESTQPYPQDARVLNYSHTKCQAQIDELKAQIQGLQAELNKKDARINKLEAMFDKMQQVLHHQYPNVQETNYQSNDEVESDEEESN